MKDLLWSSEYMKQLRRREGIKANIVCSREEGRKTRIANPEVALSTGFAALWCKWWLKLLKVLWKLHKESRVAVVCSQPPCIRKTSLSFFFLDTFWLLEILEFFKKQILVVGKLVFFPFFFFNLPHTKIKKKKRGEARYS